MNFSFYIFGTPNGYNQYPSDNSDMFQHFAQANTTVESQLTVYRSGSLVYYAYIRRLQEKSSDYMGFCLVFNGVYCRNSQKLFSLFNRAFDDVQLKGEIMKFEKGKSFFTVNKFAEKQNEIERIKDFFKNYIENDFRRDFEALPTSFRIGNGQKSISVRETNDAIIAAIREYDCVHITNSEKSLSELERVHKLLSGLYGELETLRSKYRKLLLQKKNYGIVFLVLSALLVCLPLLFLLKTKLDRSEMEMQLRENIKNQSNMVDHFVSSDTVYLHVPDSVYHLFANCAAPDEMRKGSVGDAFQEGETKLCSKCMDSVGIFQRLKEDAEKCYDIGMNLDDEKYLRKASDYYGELLLMRPENKEFFERHTMNIEP